MGFNSAFKGLSEVHGFCALWNETLRQSINVLYTSKQCFITNKISTLFNALVYILIPGIS